MKLPRRQFLHLAAGAAALSAVSRIARAQVYPSRPVRIVVSAAPGSAPDILARLIGQWFSERLGQQFVIDDRPGGSNTIGTEAVVRAAPDGHTLLLVESSASINANLYTKLNYNFLRDIALIPGILRLPQIIAVHPSFPAKTLPEFIAYAKSNPDRLNMGTPGVGTSLHLGGELFKMMAGVNMVHVPTRGGGAALLTDLLGGQVDVIFGTTALSIELIRAGRIRPLAVTTATRWAGLPDIPTVGEFVPGYEASSILGLGAPRNTPATIIDTLNKEVGAAFADPKIMGRFTDLGGTLLPGSPADFRKIVADETEKWARVIRFTGIKSE